MKQGNCCLLLAAILATSLTQAQTVDDTGTSVATPDNLFTPERDGAATDAPRFVCSYDDRERSVAVVYDEPPQRVPCQVHYHRDSENPDTHQVLYRASNEIGYCESKAEELTDRLEGFGWSCRQESDAERGDDGPDERDAS